MIDQETMKRINLLHGAPRFVLRSDPQTGQHAVRNPSQVPRADGEYWMHGTSILSNGAELASVFVVDTDSGGTLRAIFWLSDSGWIDSQDPQAPDTLDLPRDRIFPFDWRFDVPLEEDIFHPDPGTLPRRTARSFLSRLRMR
ncbi:MULTISPECIES: hypothetical protein [unclassified Mameliella]|uniref:hypothetical protein n=1 Tax=unclassified Mameliella TaxID=2630630 RepID=UPI00273D2AB5|nr:MULTISPECIES: hypothetical protein [unclassified Mameliella]